MGRSLGFGCTTCNSTPFQTRFRSGCGPAALTLLHMITPRVILQKARRQTSQGVVLRLLVGARLQGQLFPSRGASHLSLTVLVHYRSLGVFSLREWSPQIHAEFHGFRITRVRANRRSRFVYRAFTVYGSSFQRDSTTRLAGMLLAPRPQFHQETGLGCSRFARHYSGNRVRFLLLRLLRCFSSAACLYPPYRFRREFQVSLLEGCPIRKSPGQTVSVSPRLIVANNVLHRLQVPRHPPCALSNLTTLVPVRRRDLFSYYSMQVMHKIKVFFASASQDILLLSHHRAKRLNDKRNGLFLRNCVSLLTLYAVFKVLSLEISGRNLSFARTSAELNESLELAQFNHSRRLLPALRLSFCFALRQGQGEILLSLRRSVKGFFFALRSLAALKQLAGVGHRGKS